MDFAVPDRNIRLKTEGDWLVSSEGHKYPVTDGVPRFVDSSDYAESWSWQWQQWANLHDRYTEKPLSFFVEHFFDPADRSIPPMKVLDSSCGAGRYIAQLSGTQHQVWGSDLSSSVYVAASKLGEAGNIALAQADMNHLPFLDDFFDFVYCESLIHVPDVPGAVRSLSRVVRPGGTLVLVAARKIPKTKILALIREAWIGVLRRVVKNRSEEFVMKTFRNLNRLYRTSLRQLCPVLTPDPEWRECYIHDYITAVYRRRLTGSDLVSALPTDMQVTSITEDNDVTLFATKSALP